MAPTDEPGIEPMEVWNGVLRDVREVTQRDPAVVVTHRIVATSPTSVRFQIVDPFPAEFDLDEIGFHPNFEPDHGRLDTGQAVITGVAEPEQELLVKYGFEPQRQLDSDAVQRVQQRTKPAIEMATKVADSEADDLDLETASMTRSSSGAPPPDAESSNPFSDIQRRIEEKEADAWGADSTEEGGLDDDPMVDPSSAEEETETADVAGSGVEESSAVDDLFEAAGAAELAESPEVRVPDSERGGDSLDDTEPDAAGAASSGPLEDEVTEPNDGGAESMSESDPDEDPAVVQALIDQLEANRLTDEQRRQLADQLGSVLDERDRERRSTEVRLGHLESQLQRFEAYADALEAVIDVHGPAQEFLSEVRDDIAALESSVDDITRNLDNASEARSAQRRRLNELADELTTHDSRLERLRDRLESLRNDHRRETATLDDRLTEVEPVVEQFEALESKVATLQKTMERLEARLKAVGDALSTPESE